MINYGYNGNQAGFPPFGSPNLPECRSSGGQSTCSCGSGCSGCSSCGSGCSSCGSQNPGCRPPAPPKPPVCMRGCPGPMGPMGPIGPTGADGVSDYASFINMATDIPASETLTRPIELIMNDSQAGTAITLANPAINLPSGHYMVQYSLQGTASTAGTAEVVPYFGGGFQEYASRSDSFDTQGNVNGVFTVNAQNGTSLSFYLRLFDSTVALSNVKLSVVVIRLAK